MRLEETLATGIPSSGTRRCYAIASLRVTEGEEIASVAKSAPSQ